LVNKTVKRVQFSVVLTSSHLKFTAKTRPNDAVHLVYAYVQCTLLVYRWILHAVADTKESSTEQSK